MGIGEQVARQVAPRVHKLAPEATSKVIHTAMHHAIEGVGPLAGAAEAAEKQLAERPGDYDRAVHQVIEFNVRLAAVEGFATNLGGLLLNAALLPANVAGLAMIELRMVAGIAHLRGYDLTDGRVRNALLACLLGEASVKAAVKAGRIPMHPYEIANAPAYDAALDRILAAEVAADLISDATGKRIVTIVGKRIPVLGGAVGAGTDAYDAWKVGRYADRELFSKRRR